MPGVEFADAVASVCLCCWLSLLMLLVEFADARG